MQGKFFQLQNVHGMQVHLLDYGATVTAVKVPAKNGELVNLALGFDTLAEYEAHPFYFGCTVGRVANRIAHGKFSHAGNDYHLARNENNFCHLHGGVCGFDKVFWQASQTGNVLVFNYVSPANEEGYPGKLAITTTYTLNDQNELKIQYHATTDAPTPINLTNHTYWNLQGEGTILDHTLTIFSDEILAADDNHIPTGNIISVAGTAFDFLEPQKIGACLTPNGYDHCYVLATPPLAARVTHSGRTLETFTTQPGMQFYSGNSLHDYPIAAGKHTQRHGGFCLETQGFTDAVNQPHFPTVILLPENIYQHETIYKLYF
jgi:aldose 1-epimerase